MPVQTGALAAHTLPPTPIRERCSATGGTQVSYLRFRPPGPELARSSLQRQALSRISPQPPRVRAVPPRRLPCLAQTIVDPDDHAKLRAPGQSVDSETHRRWIRMLRCVHWGHTPAVTPRKCTAPHDSAHPIFERCSFIVPSRPPPRRPAAAPAATRSINLAVQLDQPVILLVFRYDVKSLSAEFTPLAKHELSDCRPHPRIAIQSVRDELVAPKHLHTGKR